MQQMYFTCILILKYLVISGLILDIGSVWCDQDVVTENEFEKRLLADVIPPSDIGVTFDDIGALENVKDTLKELVMLPLQRPELFCKGQLTKVLRYSLAVPHFCFRVVHNLLVTESTASLVPSPVTVAPKSAASGFHLPLSVPHPRKNKRKKWPSFL